MLEFQYYLYIYFFFLNQFKNALFTPNKFFYIYIDFSVVHVDPERRGFIRVLFQTSLLVQRTFKEDR